MFAYDCQHCVNDLCPVQVVARHYDLSLNESVTNQCSSMCCSESGKDVQPILKLADSDDNKESVLAEGFLGTMQYLSKQLNYCMGAAYNQKIRPKLKELDEVLKDILKFLAEEHSNSEMKKFNSEIQFRLLKSWTSDGSLEQKTQCVGMKYMPVALVALLYVLKIIYYTLGFDLHQTWAEVVDEATFKHPELGEYFVSRTFLETPLSKTVPPIMKFVKKFFEGHKHWFSDLLNISGMVHGLYQRNEHNELTNIQPYTAPCTLLPTKIRRKDFQYMRDIQLIWHKVLLNMMNDFAWLESKLESAIGQDPFIGKLLKIAKDCRGYPHRSKFHLGIIRSDYMFDSPTNLWKQVEYNTIASGGSMMGEGIVQAHDTFDKYRKTFQQSEEVGPSDNSVMFQESFSAAFDLYGNPNAVVVFIVGENEVLIADHRKIEMILLKSRGIRSVRKQLHEIYKQGVLDEETGRMTVDGDEVAIFYFRNGYVIEQYPTEAEWKAREMIERSRAIKCPSIELHLVNFKLFQVVLADELELARFLPDHEERMKLRQCFAEFWTLDHPSELKRTRDMVAKNLKGYVLKPQREGGGNNYFEEDILKIIDEALEGKRPEISSYLLMSKIEPLPQFTAVMKSRELAYIRSIPEIGIFGCMLGTTDNMILSKASGYLVRTKSDATNEGGMVRGYSFYDSLYLS